MPRRTRDHVPGGTHHVTLRGNDRMPLFTDGHDDDPRIAAASPPEPWPIPAPSCDRPCTLDALIAEICERHQVDERALASRDRSRRHAAIRAEIAAAAMQHGVAKLADVERRSRRDDSVLCRAVTRHARPRFAR